MNWNDSGFLLSKNKYNENSIIAEIYTEDHGKCSGIIFGASSQKLKNYLQVGNKLHVNHTFKTEGKIGYFKIEIIRAHAPLYFDNKKKLLCITSAFNLIKLLTVDFQENSKIFNLIDNFYTILDKENWINEYIFWELELLKLIGYDLVFKNLVNKEKINDEIKYFVKSTSEKKFVPNFLIEKNKDELNNTQLLNGLKLVGNYLDKNILKPNNINFPESRINFINILK